MDKILIPAEQTENKFGKVSRISIRAAAHGKKTYLKDISFTAPYKIMSPFEKADGGIQIMPLCASAGIMRGDCQEFSYYVETGASLEVLSQSFEKIHKMEGGLATRKIRIQVESNAFLSYFPQPVIPFADSAFTSDMQIYLTDKTSGLFLQEIISCGRTAHNERFAYRLFASKVMIYRNGVLIYRDNTRYEPDKMPLESIGMYEGYTHMANIFISCPANTGQTLSDGTDNSLREQIWDILEKETDCEGGVTSLVNQDLAVRIFGKRAQTLQEVSEKIRALLSGTLFIYANNKPHSYDPDGGCDNQ